MLHDYRIRTGRNEVFGSRWLRLQSVRCPSTQGADLVACCTLLRQLGELVGGHADWTLLSLQVHYVRLQNWNCLPLLEKLSPSPSQLLCDPNTVARPCYLSLRSQMACEQIFRPADHLRERVSPLNSKARPHTVLRPHPMHAICACSVRFFVHHRTRSNTFPGPACHCKLLSYTHGAWGLGTL